MRQLRVVGVRAERYIYIREISYLRRGETRPERERMSEREQERKKGGGRK